MQLITKKSRSAESAKILKHIENKDVSVNVLKLKLERMMNIPLNTVPMYLPTGINYNRGK